MFRFKIFLNIHLFCCLREALWNTDSERSSQKRLVFIINASKAYQSTAENSPKQMRSILHTLFHEITKPFFKQKDYE